MSCRSRKSAQTSAGPKRRRRAGPWHVRVWENVAVSLPAVLMGLLAAATWWLVKNTPVPDPETTLTESTPPKPRGRFASMTIEELQTKYLEVVGRATGSDDRRYLIWKIREAEKGRINVGPRKTRARDGEPLDVKILPLRLEADVADKMDEAWRAKGIKNRMEFFRGAIGHYLAHLGARAQDVGGLHLPFAGAAAGAGDQAGARIADLFLGQARVGDGVAHRDVAVGRGIAHEALELAVDGGLEVEFDRAADLAAQAAFGVVGQEADARAPGAQRGGHAVEVVAEAGRDAHARHHHATLGAHIASVDWPSFDENRPTRMSRAT